MNGRKLSHQFVALGLSGSCMSGLFLKMGSHFLETKDGKWNFLKHLQFHRFLCQEKESYQWLLSSELRMVESWLEVS